MRLSAPNPDSMRKKHFYVGYSGTSTDLQRLLACGIPIQAVFTGGVVGKIANTQRQYLPDFDVLSQQVEICHDAGVQIEILLDVPCFSARHLWVRGQPLFIEYFGQLEEVGVDGVIVSDPVMVELVKAHSDLYITVSHASCVNSVSRARFYQRLGADAIILDPMLNRQYGRLKQVVDVLDQSQPRLLLNEGCLAQCPYRSFHQNLLAHPDTPIASDYYLLNCTAQRLEDPSLILSSPTIRPEDLPAYQQLLNHYCLAPRSVRRSTTQSQILQAYAAERYDGNLLDLLSNSGYPDMTNLVIQNRALDGAWDAVWKDCMTAGNCNGCNYCRHLLERALSSMENEQSQQYFNDRR